ncbi:MAG TPA: hypothetical protein VMT17_05980 [Anaeromyxobacteraceae bacterium]|nr:hypothetical protein [Anaeromyxobacteraceae bacterium]
MPIGSPLNVAAQERRVEKAADVLSQVGVSDTVKARLKAEEERLAVLRETLAQARTPGPASQTPKVSTAQVRELLKDLGQIAAMKSTTAALRGGRVFDEGGCGGHDFHVSPVVQLRVPKETFYRGPGTRAA